ncbi:hypothetical protein BKA67DRAFT_646553 [Truncatella angustata]|uniref:Uncharacterized protein n=1 Tax=Truncatella angustata TaxID=152316 RepID=A0A9P8UN21_9PEZI|nr:uncharacterized protein BKA67DRAFT_646553 [Truncatella angustata]KAH6654915.1 hypothetical protein BKA67DRAFT_646553 [Truncatella angustata]
MPRVASRTQRPEPSRTLHEIPQQSPEQNHPSSPNRRFRVPHRSETDDHHRRGSIVTPHTDDNIRTSRRASTAPLSSFSTLTNGLELMKTFARKKRDKDETPSEDPSLDTRTDHDGRSSGPNVGSSNRNHSLDRGQRTARNSDRLKAKSQPALRRPSFVQSPSPNKVSPISRIEIMGHRPVTIHHQCVAVGIMATGHQIYVKKVIRIRT